MIQFDRKKFFDGFRQWQGIVTPKQVEGLTYLLDCIENDPFMIRVDWISYCLGTTFHETAHTFMPIHEYGSRAYFIKNYGYHGPNSKGAQLGNDTLEEGYDYAGKGFVQLTGEYNYENMEIALRKEYPALIADFQRRTGKTFDLTVGDQPNDKDDPKNAMDPKIAYAIMSYGMRHGTFTGKSLGDYFSKSRREWVSARRIINGLDKAQRIAEYAMEFFDILNDSVINTGVPEVDRTQQSASTSPSSPDNPSNETVTTPTVLQTDPQDNSSTNTSGSPPAETGNEVNLNEQSVNLNEQSVNGKAEVQELQPYNKIGFWATIKRDFLGCLGGYSVPEVAQTVAERSSSVPEWLVPVLIKVATIIFWGAALYLGFRIVHFIIDTLKQLHRIRTEADAKTAVNRKDIVWKP